MMFFRRLGMIIVMWFKLTRVFFQILYGAWRISWLPKPVVTIFGGSKLPLDDPYAKMAHSLATRLVDADISVLTGGGPGIMQAASCGARPVKGGKGQSMGIGVTDLGEQQNPCVQKYFVLNYFFARKYLLVRSAVAFIVFPGGFGTLDELMETLTLIETKIMKRMPIVLVGKEYWQPLIEWLTDEALQHGLIKKEDFALFTVTDDLEEVFCLVRDECELNHKV